jgi:hypothetical protein
MSYGGDCPCVTYDQLQKALRREPANVARLARWARRHGWALSVTAWRPLPGGPQPGRLAP